ncbi:MAG: hypothetical protein HGA53_08405, partial [Anaerolineaceae bacterium]|nr:hypothetical protein [Anaerolineaceae bacterium]
MKNRFHLFIAISLLLNLLVAPFLSLNTVQAQSGSETPYGWDLETSLSPELLAKFESTDTDLTGTLQSEGLQVERNGDQLKITGMGGMDELRRVFFEHLVESNPLISNRSDFKITLPFEDSQTLTVKLEANITTGYAWQFSGAEGVTLTQEGDTLYEDRPEAPIKGSPQIATLVFKASGTGTGTLTLAYKRSYGPDEAPLTRLNLNLETNPGEIDLSNPNPVLSAQMENLDLITSSAVSDVPMVGLPSSWDWRTQGIVPPIRDQGGCGSCWAFATVGAMESAIAKGGGP